MNSEDAREERRRNEPGEELNGIAAAFLEAAIEVHRVLGPGFNKEVYHYALTLELRSRCIAYAYKPALPLRYKGHSVGELHPDLIVAGQLIVELKTVDALLPVHFAQTLSYLRATGLHLALLVNFNVPVLLRGVKRVILSG